MKRVNKFLRCLALVVMLCVMLATVAYAAEAGQLWLSLSRSENGKNTSALIITDTTVTDGLVKVTYDPEALTYEGVMVSSGYVAMHAVNADEAGVVLISWVAPEAYESDGSAVTLIEVRFQGASDAIEAAGIAHDVAGNALTIGVVDASALEEALAKAEELAEEDYTEETWGALEEAKAAAEEVLEDPTATQSEIDQAAAALEAAMVALEEYVEPVDKSELEKAIDKADALKEKDYSEKSWAALQAALKVAESVYADENATQEEVDDAADALNKAIKALVPATGKNPGTGDDSQLVLVAAIGAMALVAVVVLVTMNSRKNKKGGK